MVLATCARAAVTPAIGGEGGLTARRPVGAIACCKGCSCQNLRDFAALASSRSFDGSSASGVALPKFKARCQGGVTVLCRWVLVPEKEMM